MIKMGNYLFCLLLFMTVAACFHDEKVTPIVGSDANSGDTTQTDVTTQSDDMTPDEVEDALLKDATIVLVDEQNKDFSLDESFWFGTTASIEYSIQLDPDYESDLTGLGAVSGGSGMASNTQMVSSNVSKDSEETIDSYDFELSYNLPTFVLPAEAIAQLKPGVPRLKAFARAGEGGGQSTVKVVVKGTVKKAGKEAAGEYLKKRFGDKGKNVGSGAKAVLDVISALEAAKEHSDLMDRLDEMEDCVKNPLHPLDQKTYQDNPSKQQDDLDKIEGVRNEVKQNTGVRFFNKWVNKAAGYIKATKPLWPIISGPSSYTDSTLKDVNKDLVDTIEREMPSCKNYYEGRMNLRSSIDSEDNDDETKNIVDLKDMRWKLSRYATGDVAVYQMSRAGDLQIVRQGAAWEEECDRFDQVFHGVEYSGTLLVYVADRSDAYARKYAWGIRPKTVIKTISAICDDDGVPDTPRVPTPKVVALHSHLSSCGYATPPYEPFGMPSDMPSYSTSAILEGSGSWTCEYLDHNADWLLTEVILSN
ncbi:MAG: hypothetical protein OEZ43_15610 [Gammaproteobacteria bacterium]|nr:hypothetical protein [Gammaproteobacteria bacterium]